MKYKWIKTTFEESRFLGSFKSLFDEDSNLELFLPESCTKASRREFDGAFTFVGSIGGKRVGLIYNDFKIYGGSFGTNNSQRMVAFLDALDQSNTPLVFGLNTIGVRISEGRKVFPSAFQLIPALKKYVERNLAVTCITGRCLGLGAILFGLGDYRVAFSPESTVNLTGPEVFKLFFGEKASFEDAACGQRHFNKSYLVQEVFENKESMYAKVRGLISPLKIDKLSVGLADSNGKDKLQTKQQIENYEKMEELLSMISAERKFIMELFAGDKCSVRSFIVETPSGPFGISINPPGRPNMIDTRTLKKYQYTLNLFKKLKLPIISIVDTPGGDPRVEQGDLNLVDELVKGTGDIIDYPYPKMGIVYGRCFGGASVLAIPKIYGGKTVAVQGAQCGIMGEHIIRQLLSGSERLLAEWEENAAAEKEDLSDFVDNGVFDKIITKEEISKEISSFIVSAYLDQQGLSEPVKSNGISTSKTSDESCSSEQTTIQVS